MKIGIVGLGLIGGSIYKKCKSLGIEVVGISKSQKGIETDIFDDYSKLKECNLVFVCCHMRDVLKVLKELDLYLTSDTTVCDVCSLKEFVSKGTYGFKFVPTHPMAGTEKSGFENSFAEMFEGAKWVITPVDNTDINELKGFIEKMGAKPVIATPKEHDEAVALISHMPMVISQALFAAVENNDLAKKLASSGFRDMTRLAMSNIDMASDMVNLNHENIQNAILKLYSNVGDLLKEDYAEKISKIKQDREKMYLDGKNVL